MYRSFLSWRYLRARLTNLIGIAGLAVAVGALIMILSIMTGFLEESVRMVRGNLSDIAVQPEVDVVNHDGRRVPREPAAALAVIRDDPRVAAASPRIAWLGIIVQVGRQAGMSTRTMSDTEGGGLNAVFFVGVDVLTRERVAAATLEALGRVLGFPYRAPRVQDDLDTTDLFTALTREPARRPSPRVPNPFDPFAAPRGYQAPVGPHRASIVVAEQLYHQLGLRVGDEVEIGTFNIDAITGRAVPSNRRFVVAGTARSGDNELDLNRVYFDRRELADFLGGTVHFTEILVKTRVGERGIRELQADLQRDLSHAGAIWWNGRDYDPFLQVKTWQDFRQVHIAAIRNERVLMAIMLSLILLVAGFTVFAILTMMVTEKRRDIGILAALGAPPRGILTTFLMIGCWDALLGTSIGAVWGTLAALHIDGIERWLSSLFGFQIFDRTVYYFDRIPSVVDPVAVAMIVGGAFLLTLACAALPAWRAARLDPLVALRYE